MAGRQLKEIFRAFHARDELAFRRAALEIIEEEQASTTMQAQGLAIPQLCGRLQISEQTFYRWRIRYGALKEDEAQRLKALEAENARLKRA